MIKQAIDAIRARAIESTLVALGTILPVWGALARDYLAGYVSELRPTTIVYVVLLSILLSAYSIAAFFWWRPNLVFSQKDGGCWLDKKTGIRYCNSCKSNKKLSPLQRKQKYWNCTVVGCYQSYPIQTNESQP